ncbi:ABC transporter ATP-binding protein [Sphaerochaeta halotolerans]|jgi:branched-chain amino acid transport system ATP-binding protein|uniref:ABC transporter ATP-binding protein n=1 Tax=Sphaerochaeta halotolerans TaxID=2293840 RepID=A0A372MKP5_9SPIR|nr:ABC transporter ATP-binding protein [Sphaerochaeta halotolerans]MBG0766445.1 ABC transporter ATP-binding protein [Spirochaetaceae bacterium]MDK2859871.1 branched-chain amino acid transport system ATP-binding protein [Sphaerochaeta sp.]MDN5333103.1 branched-chain amino acid transport system ATP-binding protein [Sphaerochaeta sp.]MXI85394.1 ATP-binding cassette domain-containing protein [Sphaerochaeta halotolerans]RFU95938.1 ABC transporter ATP-binding protein [Sphaerochaeta halotolerans]
MKELLTIDDISVSYGNIKALKQVSMHVNEGDVVCLIGANGSGKSTLLKSIMGQEPLDSGSITFDGEEICRAKNAGAKQGKRSKILTTDLIAAKGISLVPEGRRVFADMTVEENLDMGAFLVRDDALIAERKESMYDFFPILGARRRQKTRSLSGGEQQMMAIARALMSGPRLILLDEPGLGLAPLVIADIFEKIALINQQDKVTVFLVEQNARMALRASSEGYVMENGRIVLSDASSTLLENERVREAYLGE